jgi:methanogenic corrinoid protein MtbC1
MSYRIKTVAMMTGIPRATIVAWERRYNLLDPNRSPSGYRIYSDDDVAYLRALKQLVDDGLAISEAIDTFMRTTGIAARPYEAQTGAARRLPLDPVSLNAPGSGLAHAALRQPQLDVFPAHASAAESAHRPLLDALLAFDRTTADRVVLRLQALPFETLIDGVYLPILRDVGDAWERGDVTVAQEHFVSGFCREVLMGMFHALGAGPDGGTAVTCAGPPGEQHEIGLLAIAVRLAMRGFRVTWLGTDLPFEDLCAFLARHPPRLLCLTAMRRELAPEVSSYARQVRACAHPDTIVAVGGPGADGLESAGTETLWYVGSMDALLARWSALNGAG